MTQKLCKILLMLEKCGILLETYFVLLLISYWDFFSHFDHHHLDDSYYFDSSKRHTVERVSPIYDDPEIVDFSAAINRSAWIVE